MAEAGHRGRLEDQVAVITGGASGIGQATARLFAREGAHVVVVDVHAERIEQTLAQLRASGREHWGLKLDVRSEHDMARMARETVERFGRIDHLVACAGVLRGPGSSPKPLLQISEEEWDYVLDINLKGTFLSNRAVLGVMTEQKSGNIVNLSSVAGLKGTPNDGPYSASKFGVIGMSQALAEEARVQGVRVQIVIPDAVDTPIWDQNGPVPKPPNALAPERVADLILHLVCQPDDTLLLNAVIAPFRARRRVKKRHPESAGEEA